MNTRVPALLLAAVISVAACGGLGATKSASATPVASGSTTAPLSPTLWASPEVPSATPSGSASVLPEGALVVIDWRGGECRTGICGTSVTITVSGQVSRDGGPGAGVPQPLLAALVDAIRATDFGIVLSRPFTGSCPTFVDGLEAVYTIATPTGTVEIASCTVEVDPVAPLFAAITRVADLAPTQ